MTIQKALGQIGLTTNEVKVYLALIDLGTTLAGSVARKAKLHRRQTYDALHRLIGKGLASYTIKLGKKHFRPVDPERILDIAKEREMEIQSVIPEIIGKFRKTESKVHAEIYEGTEGLKSVMELILKEKKEWYTIGSTGKGPVVLPFYLEQFARKRVKLGIKRKVLLVDSKEGRAYYKVLKQQGLVKIKFLPKEIQQPQTIWIFDDKVAIILVSVECPVVFLIDNKEIADFYKEYFNLLWNKV
jgi:sugar-specific transcriptional regulator TrmB